MSIGIVTTKRKTVEFQTTVPPPPPTKIKSIPRPGGNIVTWEDPEDIIFNGAILGRWERTKLLRKLNSPPENENDGTPVLNSSVRNQYWKVGYVDIGLTNGVKYYYKAFSFFSSGQVSSSESCFSTPEVTGIWGIEVDLNNISPESNITYIDDARGMEPGISWESVPPFKDIKPCLFKNGVVQYYLSKSDFSKKESGENSILTGEDGDVMIEIPYLGINFKVLDNRYLRIRLTTDQNLEEFEKYAHQKPPFTLEKIYIGAFLASYGSDGRFSSTSGRSPYKEPVPSSGNYPVESFVQKAATKGGGYEIFSFYEFLLLQCLFLLKYKTINTKRVLGSGANGTNLVTGVLNNHWDSPPHSTRVKFLGLEDTWLDGSGSLLLAGVGKTNSWGGPWFGALKDFQNFNTYFEMGREAFHGGGNFRRILTTKAGFLPTKNNNGYSFRGVASNLGWCSESGVGEESPNYLFTAGNYRPSSEGFGNMFSFYSASTKREKSIFTRLCFRREG